MTGNEIMELKQNEKIDVYIDKNSDKPYLNGYRHFINDSASTTVYNYLRHVCSFMNYCKKDIKDLDLDDFTIYLSSIKNTTQSYQIVAYAALKKFSMYLLASNKNISNPMQYIKRPKFKESKETIDKRNIGYLEKKEIKKYLNAVVNGAGTERATNRQKNWKERDLLIVLIFLNTGMRCSALCKLDVENIDITNKKLYTVDKGDVLQEYDLSEEIITHVINWINKRKVLLGDINEKALFISNRRERMSQFAVSSVVNKYADNIKGKHITPHKLRATYGTQIYEATGDLYLTQQCMGHKNPKTTELYIRGQEENIREVASGIMSKLTTI